MSTPTPNQPENLRPNVHMSGHIVWNTQQVKDVLDKLDADNGVIKVEITHGFEPGARQYYVNVWRYPSMDIYQEEREANR